MKTDNPILPENCSGQKPPVIRSGVRTEIAGYLRGLQSVCDELLVSGNPQVIRAGTALIDGIPAQLRELLQLPLTGGDE